MANDEATTKPTIETILERINALATQQRTEWESARRFAAQRFEQLDTRLDRIESEVKLVHSEVLTLRADFRESRAEFNEFREHSKESVES